MRRERAVAALGAALRRARAAATGERARRAWAELRRHPDAVLAVALAAGVLAMVLHWG
jgi:hypothetical protein